MQDLGLVLIVILVLVLLWRGPKTLPKLGNALGRGVREARQEASKVQEDIQSRASADDEVEPTATAPPPTTSEATDSEPTDRPPGAA
jgi:sec-independent protein translocase protein TatA